MRSKILESFVDLRLILISLNYGRFEAVRNDAARNASKEAQSIFISFDPVCFFLTFNSFNIALLATAQDCNKHFKMSGFSCSCTNNGLFYSGKVNKHFIASFVLHVHTHLLFLSPLLIMEAKLRVAVRFGMAIKQFLPEKLQGNAGALELFFDVTKLRN